MLFIIKTIDKIGKEWTGTNSRMKIAQDQEERMEVRSEYQKVMWQEKEPDHLQGKMSHLCLLTCKNHMARSSLRRGMFISRNHK